MPKPYQRTRTKKRRLVKLPSGSGSVTYYKKQKAKTTRCSQCGRIVFGVSTQDSSHLSRTPLSKKRPQRMFGGQLCHSCTQELLKHATRGTIST